MQEREIPLNSRANDREVERTIDEALADSGLRVTIRASLRKFPGCVHWHVKRGREPGTLEITFWPRERRAWFTIHDGRQADWMEQSMKILTRHIRRGTREA